MKNEIKMSGNYHSMDTKESLKENLFIAPPGKGKQVEQLSFI